MPEKENFNVNFDSDDPAEQKLWAALEGLPREAPSADMRRSFYRELERTTTVRWPERIRNWLGLSSRRGWLTAAASVLVGVSAGQFYGGTENIEVTRLAALEENIALLNRELILDRMQDATAGQRLRGVIDAGDLVEEDLEITRALLVRATEDRVQSVRSAAIGALGPSLTSTSVGQELMSLLENAESPLVQLALVDLVLRNGNKAQLEYLLQLTKSDKLHPDLIKHIEISLGRETV
jgi:hypothetical protein